MENLWDAVNSAEFEKSDLLMRVYTSRLLGQNSDLVLHGGGNTSVKGVEKNIYGEEVEVLYVKGSGWDLKTIEGPGFSPCELAPVKRLVELEHLSDTQMVTELRKSLLNPSAPNPSVEAILHAIIPFKFVDHTHSDAVVAISNTPNGEQLIKELFGERALILPYTMPGFILSKQVYEATKNIDWNEIDSIILLHHGVFTFSNDAKKSYENMIEICSKAEEFLDDKGAIENIALESGEELDPLVISELRKECSTRANAPFLVKYKHNGHDFGFSKMNVDEIATRGPITPDHVISTKRIPMILDKNINDSLENYSSDYKNYFETNREEGHICLDTVPRWAIVKGKGLLSIGPDPKRLKVISDITDHTIKCIQWGEKLGGWTALPAKDIFDLEYWELEQAKLKVGKKPAEFNGRVSVVTGAASGIGRACAEDLKKRGACVIALDLNPEVELLFDDNLSTGIKCDVTSTEELKEALKKGLFAFGGVDFVVSNAGIFPESSYIDETSDESWDKSLTVNLDSHFKLLRECTPYLKLGWNPAVVFVGSKNVPAPGPGVASYSVSKAGLAQLARIAALELGKDGIRVNTIHPNAVFDTGIWSDDVLEKRAEKYGISVDEYKKNNILAETITSVDVANLVSDMLGDNFSKTTGAQVPIDGGNERVI